MPASKRLRRLRMGLATVLGLGSPQGLFLPYRYAGGITSPADGAYPEIEDAMRRAEERFRDRLDDIDALAAALAEIGQDAAAPSPRWSQDWYPGLDAAMLYSFVRTHQPRRIVEIGSGHSTRFAARAVLDGGLETRITAIDPAPRAPIEALAQHIALDIRRQTLQEFLAGGPSTADLSIGPGDLLFIDSSHLLVPGSDVDLLLNRVLPSLPTGCHVHIHDIFLPDGYPADWDWRGYNEQNAVASLFLGGGYEIVFSSHYVTTRMADRLAEGLLARVPVPATARPSALWLTKTAPGVTQA